MSRRTRKYKRWLLVAQDSRCLSCGAELTMETATIDHVIPQSKGGPDEFYNMQVLCASCNQEKGDYCCDMNERLEYHEASCAVRRLQLDRLRRMTHRARS